MDNHYVKILLFCLFNDLDREITPGHWANSAKSLLEQNEL